MLEIILRRKVYPVFNSYKLYVIGVLYIHEDRIPVYVLRMYVFFQAIWHHISYYKQTKIEYNKQGVSFCITTFITVLHGL